MIKEKDLPEGWKIVGLKELASKNHNYPIGDGDHGQIKPECYQDEGIPYIRVADMINDRISKENLVYIPKEIHNQNLKSELRPGDVLIAKTGATIGKVAVVPEGMPIANTTASIGKITLDTDKMIPKFLLYFLKTKYFREQMWRVSKKSAQPGFNIKDMKKFKIPLPPLSTQKKIVSILDKAEKLKELRKEADKLTDDYLKSVFLEMFGDPIKNEKGWEIKTLSEICKKIIDGTHHSPPNTNSGDFPYITSKNITKKGIDLTNLTYIDRKIHEEIFRRCNPEKGDILYVKDGVNTGIAQVNTLDFEFSMLSSVALLKMSKAVDPYYLSYLLNCGPMYKKIRYSMGGAAIKRLTLVKIKKIRVPVPPIELQNEFAEIVKHVEKMREYQKQSGQQIEDLFNALMQKAFRGELVC